MARGTGLGGHGLLEHVVAHGERVGGPGPMGTRPINHPTPDQPPSTRSTAQHPTYHPPHPINRPAARTPPPPQPRRGAAPEGACKWNMQCAQGIGYDAMGEGGYKMSENEGNPSNSFKFAQNE